MPWLWCTKYDGKKYLEKYVYQRGRDLTAKKTLMCLRTSGPMADFMEELLPLHETWKDFSDALIARHGVLRARVSTWRTLTSIRQSPGESIQSVADRIPVAAKVAHSVVQLTSLLAKKQLVQVFIDALMARSIKTKLTRDKSTTF